MNINAKHFQGWSFRPGDDHRLPQLLIPSSLGINMKPDVLVITITDYSPRIEKDEIARLLAHAPELFRIAERFFAFYELHKAARGGQLGREYEELRAKIMGEVKQ